MSYLISAATGNFSSAATWDLVDPASLLDNETASGAVTAAFISGTAFTPTAGTYNGVAIKFNTRINVPTGTFTVRLALGGVGIAGTTVVCNVSDIPAQTVNLAGGYWVYFKFASPVTLTAVATTVQLATSTAGELTVCTLATTNWSHALVATTTQAPIAADTTIVAGALTGPALSTFTFNITSHATTVGNVYSNGGNNYTVTVVNSLTQIVATGVIAPASATLTFVSGSPVGNLNITSTASVVAATSYTNPIVTVDTGATAIYGACNVNAHGTLAFPTTPSTNTNLNLAGNLYVRGGTLSMGTNLYTFTVTALTLATPVGGTYTNNGQTFTVAAYGIVGATTLLCTGTGAPSSGNLVLATGTGQATIPFSSFTSPVPMPSSSFATIIFNSASLAQYGLISNVPSIQTGGGPQSLITMAGNPTVRKALLTANASVGATSLTTNVSTGWAAGSYVAVAPTARTVLQYEAKGTTGPASGTTVPYPATTYAHLGTSPTQAEVIHLQSNVGVKGLGLYTSGFIRIAGVSTFVADNVEFQLLGSANGNNRGIDAQGTGAQYITNCAFHDMNNVSYNLLSIATSDNITLNGNNFYASPIYTFSGITAIGTAVTAGSVYSTGGINYTVTTAAVLGATTVQMQGPATPVPATSGTLTLVSGTGPATMVYTSVPAAATGGGTPFDIVSTTGLNLQANNNTIIGYGGGSSMLSSRAFCTGNSFSGCNANPVLTFTDDQNFPYGDWSNNVAHSNTANGFTANLFRRPGNLMAGTTTWRNINWGLYTGGLVDSGINTLTSFGNGSGGFLFNAGNSSNSFLTGWTLAGDTTFAQPIGVDINATSIEQIFLDNSSLGVASGIFVAHTTGDIDPTVANVPIDLILRNTTLGSATKIANPGNMTFGSTIKVQRLNGTAGNHEIVKRYGVITPDATIVRVGSTSTKSTRFTPNNALSYNTLQSPNRIVAIANGQVGTIGVWVRLSAVSAGDAATYNGAFPQLIVRANPAAGITSDTVLATATSGAQGAWQFISGACPAMTDDAGVNVYIQCNGTTGWMNIIDWTLT